MTHDRSPPQALVGAQRAREEQNQVPGPPGGQSPFPPNKVLGLPGPHLGPDLEGVGPRLPPSLSQEARRMACGPQYVSLAVLDPLPRRLVWSHPGRDEGESSPFQRSSAGWQPWAREVACEWRGQQECSAGVVEGAPASPGCWHQDLGHLPSPTVVSLFSFCRCGEPGPQIHPAGSLQPVHQVQAPGVTARSRRDLSGDRASGGAPASPPSPWLLPTPPRFFFFW